MGKEVKLSQCGYVTGVAMPTCKYLCHGGEPCMTQQRSGAESVRMLPRREGEAARPPEQCGLFEDNWNYKSKIGLRTPPSGVVEWVIGSSEVILVD